MKTRKSVVVILGVLVAFGLASAQSKGGGPTPPGGGGNTPGGGSTPGNSTPGTMPTPGTTRPQQPTMDLQRGWFLSGKVMLEDGTPPPEPVTIERVCGAARVPEAYTDSKGRFSFEVGRAQNVMRDASISTNDTDPFSTTSSQDPMGGSSGQAGSSRFASQRLMGCDLLAVLTGFRSDSVNLSSRRVMDNPDVGTIVLHRLSNVQGNTISATSLEAPKEAKKAYEKGLDSIKKQKWAEAQQNLEKAVGIYPKYAAAWYELGVAQVRQNNIAAAETSFNKSIEADPKFLKPYMPMTGIAVQQRKWEQVADYSDKLLKLDPVDFPQAFLYNAIANAALQKYDTSELSAREAIKLDTRHQFPYAEYVLGVSLANRRDYAGALEMMKSYLGRVPSAPNAEAIKSQILQLEKETQAAMPAAAPTQKP
jgi:tetratricopeptide (TPR) repeat protein